MILAEQLRREWLAKYGMNESEINESIEVDPPDDENKELRQLRALKEIERLNESYEAGQIWNRVRR